MKKFNLKVFKKGKPIYWVAGAVILFVIFYLFLNRGGGQSAPAQSGGVVSYNSGPSDAQISAASQISGAQIQANAAINQQQLQLAGIREDNSARVAIAGLENQLGVIAINAETGLQRFNIDAGREVDLATINATKEYQYLQAEYSLETARIASDATIRSREIDRSILGDQLRSNILSLNIQSDNLIAQTALSQISSLKKKDRDNTLQFLTQQFTSGNATPNYSKDRFLGL